MNFGGHLQAQSARVTDTSAVPAGGVVHSDQNSTGRSALSRTANHRSGVVHLQGGQFQSFVQQQSQHARLKRQRRQKSEVPLLQQPLQLSGQALSRQQLLPQLTDPARAREAAPFVLQALRAQQRYQPSPRPTNQGNPIAVSGPDDLTAKGRAAVGAGTVAVAAAAAESSVLGPTLVTGATVGAVPQKLAWNHQQGSTRGARTNSPTKTEMNLPGPGTQALPNGLNGVSLSAGPAVSMGPPAPASGPGLSPNGVPLDLALLMANQGNTLGPVKPQSEEMPRSSTNGDSGIVARSPIVDSPNVNSCVYRLVRFCEDQRNWKQGASLETFWRPFTNKYFDHTAKMLLDIGIESSSDEGETKTVDVPAEFIPRYFKSKFDAGAEEERLMMATPYEHLLQNGITVVDCPRTTVLTVYPKSKMVTEGHLRVSFNEARKIILWEFSSRSHEELYTREVALQGLPPPTCRRYGLPPAVLELLAVAQALNDLNEEIDKLAENNHQSPELLAYFAQQQEDLLSMDPVLIRASPVEADFLAGMRGGGFNLGQLRAGNGSPEKIENIPIAPPNFLQNQIPQPGLQVPANLFLQPQVSAARAEPVDQINQLQASLREGKRMPDPAAAAAAAAAANLLVTSAPQPALNPQVSKYVGAAGGRTSPSISSARNLGKRKTSGSEGSGSMKKKKSRKKYPK